MVAKRGICCYTGILIGILCLLPANSLQAQMGPAPTGQFGLAIGPRVGGDYDEKTWSIGGQARVSVPFLPGLLISPSADVFLLDDQNEWQANLDVVLQLFPIVYGGAGLAVARDSLPTSEGPSTEMGYNLFLGATIPALRFPVKPFLEVRWTEINRLVSPRRVVVGFNFTLSGEPYRR